MTQNESPKITPKKSTLQIVIVPVIAIIVLLIMVAWLAGFFDSKIAPALNKANYQNLTSQQDIYTVIAKNKLINEPVAASVEAKQATIISSRILARINKINFRAGDIVEKGDILIELEQHDLHSQVLQVQQNINALKVRYKEAKQNYKRAVELFKTELISEFELDKNKANYQSISAELTAAEQALSSAEITLSYAKLAAPINGKIVDRFAEPGDTAQLGRKLLSLYNPLSLRVEAQVREKLALTLTHGQQIVIELPTVNKTITGKIEEIVPAANTGSRSFLVKARINDNGKLLPGMYARMIIPAGEESTLIIPQDRVAHVGQLDFVWLTIEDNIQRRLIRLGKKEKNDMVVVISGLNVGDQIISLK